ncbi:hypothetical protein [Spiroplasma endosymbiont of Virgichneumon dumeticola]|uniref:hypothetical protein n=1 Tax=Spiroplasma endosymbiont of Virgichneumon dumeticola TaxID=3139323 RepID=UPI0035C884ED
MFINDSQKQSFSLVEFDSATADTLDGSTCVKEIVSKEKSKKSLGVYETWLKKIEVYNNNIKKISVNNLKLKICEWIDK